MKRIVVLGGGISGYGSAILAKKEGFDVFLSDSGRIADRFKARLDEWHVPYEEGGHTPELILSATEVVKSPGIPEKAPMVKALRERGIPIVSEIEFAGRYMGKARTICITGSNGKTTTTSLIYKIMCDAGMNVALGGNIGESFAYSVATGSYDWYVLELSSFQLDGMYRFRADIGVLMNITPDHLDRYDYCFQNYVDSKMRITQNQNSRNWFVYSADDETVWAEVCKRDLSVRQLPFMARNSVASGAGDAFLMPDGIFTATAGKQSVEIDTAKMQIRGCTTPTTPWPQPWRHSPQASIPNRYAGRYTISPPSSTGSNPCARWTAYSTSTTRRPPTSTRYGICLLYTSDAADE